ncbi:hypothetical protein MSG28_000320 [Choristoneura fumiferana]|uniref:Uncharacterized protein n=1 Tax=Choristoneura fumiferana TaxID=7141 RepID=A0ACC0K069_CHOFU|nr:hypothetical protein MSG28_000320 [Choristoneura fumiferana]
MDSEQPSTSSHRRHSEEILSPRKKRKRQPLSKAENTTLANIFKSDSGNDESVNSSLKYKPPQLKKTEFKSENTKSEDPNASHCVFSCSLIAYEW